MTPTLTMKVTSNSYLRLSVKGFTLFELLITLTITSILILIAIPNFNSYSAKAHSKSIIQELSGFVRLARNHAIHHQQPAIMCPSKDGIKCSQNWEDGVLILQDNNNNKQVDGTETIIHFHSPFIKQGKLQWTALRNHLSFSGHGVTGSSAGSFIYCPKSQDPRYAHALILSFSGKVRYAQDSNNDGIRESGNNKNIVCL